MKIVHLVNADKFTTGYINFMKLTLDQYDHYFIYLKGQFDINPVDNIHILQIENYWELVTNRHIRKLFAEADKIIVSGVFNFDIYFNLYPNKILSKTFFHFWGGDFYQFENPERVSKRIHKLIMKNVVGRCRGCIFLIQGEDLKLKNILDIQKEIKSYIAPMPDDPCNRINLADFRIQHKQSQKPVKILVGNSATKTNNHIEAFEILQRFPLDSLEIYVPLSYGDVEYRNVVLEQGKKILGNAFHPILHLMNIAEYTRFLSSMDIGIFNNDRQQALGNIYRMLGLGAKVYLRHTTTMWEVFTKEGYSIYDIDSINGKNLSDFAAFPEEYRKHNEQVFDDEETDSMERARTSWMDVFAQ